MRNVTLSADEDLIENARRKAESEHTTLNNLFRSWLAEYAGNGRLDVPEIEKIVSRVSHFRVGRRLSRDERNER